jgi:hypothetical protein
MKHLTLLTSTILTLSFTASTVLAATPTPTKSTTDTPISSSSSEITDGVVEKIKDVVRNNPSVTPPIAKPVIIGLVGHVKTVNSDTFTFIDKQNSISQVKTDENTTIVSGSKTIKFKDLAVNDRMIVIGINLNSDDILLAKRIIVVPEPKITSVRSTIAGTITKIDTKNKTINLKTLDQKDLKITISSKSTPTIGNLETDQKILAIISTNTETEITTLLKTKILE